MLRTIETEVQSIRRGHRKTLKKLEHLEEQVRAAEELEPTQCEESPKQRTLGDFLWGLLGVQQKDQQNAA